MAERRRATDGPYGGHPSTFPGEEVSLGRRECLKPLNISSPQAALLLAVLHWDESTALWEAHYPSRPASDSITISGTFCRTGARHSRTIIAATNT